MPGALRGARKTSTGSMGRAEATVAQAPSAICEELREGTCSPASPSSTCPPTPDQPASPHHPPAAPACMQGALLSPASRAPVLCPRRPGAPREELAFLGYPGMRSGAPVSSRTPSSPVPHSASLPPGSPSSGLTSHSHGTGAGDAAQTLVAEHS